jgi:prefoldin subunit 5
MPDTDKILEAEQSIQNIAAELKRMRDAATLLQESQETKDALLRAAEKVIKDTGEFAISCGDIIRKLSATDLNQRLDSILGRMDGISGLVDEHAKTTNAAIAATESRIVALEDTLQAVAKGAAKKRIISMWLIILTLVSSLSALAVIVSRGIGG